MSEEKKFWFIDRHDTQKLELSQNITLYFIVGLDDIVICGIISHIVYFTLQYQYRHMAAV